MSRKLLFTGCALLIGGVIYGTYQYLDATPSTSSPTEIVTTSQPAILDELPDVINLPITTSVLPTASSTPTPTIKRAPEKLVILAEGATPGNLSRDPLIQQGKGLLSTGKFQEAQAAFEKAEPQDPVALYYLSLIASYFGDRTQAEKYFSDIKALPNIETKISSNIKKIADAYALFDTYQDARNEFLDTLIAKQFLVIGEVDLAIGKLEYVQKKVPEYTDVNTLLGAAYLTKGNYEQAVSVLSKALPNDRPEVYYWLGVAHLYQQNFNKAIAAFQLSLNKSYRPSFKPYEKIGDAYVALNNFEAAVTAYTSAFDNPEGSQYVDLYVRPVWILIEKLQRPADALAMATQAVTKLPQSAMAHNLVGWSQLASNNAPEAKAALDRALALDPTLAAVYLNLGNYYRYQNNIPEAQAAYGKAISFDKQGSIASSARARLEALNAAIIDVPDISFTPENQ